METNNLVKKIHAEFDTASDSLLKASNTFFFQYDEKKNALAIKRAAVESKLRAEMPINVPYEKRTNLLKEIGFTGTPEVESLRLAESDVSEKRGIIFEKIKASNEYYDRLSAELEEEKEQHSYAVYYKNKYPFLKFITEYQLNCICEKYNLHYASVDKYTGNVPQKNIDEIISMDKVEDYDKPYVSDYAEGYGPDEPIRFFRHIMAYRNWGEERKDEAYEKSGLFIACDKSMLNTGDLTEKGYGFFKKRAIFNPDPIVFRYVKGGVLIITKWGDEADAPELVVPELN